MSKKRGKFKVDHYGTYMQRVRWMGVSETAIENVAGTLTMTPEEATFARAVASQIFEQMWRQQWVPPWAENVDPSDPAEQSPADRLELSVEP